MAADCSEQAGAVMAKERDARGGRRLWREVCWAVLICLWLASPSWSSGAETMSVEELLQSAEQWAKENLDDDALKALQQVDREKVKRLLEDLQKNFQGEYVVDLAAFKDTVVAIIPLLEGYEETLPYAVWLKTRLDYLEVANEFKLTIPPPKAKPGQRPAPIVNPAPRVEREIWVKKVATRAAPKPAKTLATQLKPIFLAERVPAELVWIAEVESSFDPRARSPKGAVGLFQLMPATARRYGLRVSPFDQRVNANESARAAAKYLRFLHGHFKEWRLALAAYNAGEGTVDTLLKKRKAHTFDEIATRLPAETQMFVPRVEAVILRREGARLNQL
jgi:membrane-bound lytic murein transglycosylase D